MSHDRDQRRIAWLGSRVLSPAESNYSILEYYSNIEREALAFIEAVKYFHKFLAMRKFFILSDHKLLQYIRVFKSNNVPERISARLQRWAITLPSHNYEVQYVRGDAMHAADTMSRLSQSGECATPINTQQINMIELNSLSDLVGGGTLL